MSSSINTINGNGMSLQFEEFARLAGASTKGTNVVRFLGSSDAATVHEVAVTTSDKVGKWFRSDGVKAANDTTRAIFRQSIVDMFGGEALIPDNVKEAMKLKDYGKGKPLTAKRIQIVKAAVDAAMREFPTGRPRISAPTGQVRPAWPEDGLVTVQDVTQSGYAPAELKKLSAVVNLYQEAMNCSLEDAQEAALDPKSDARRLFRYGGAFTASADNFKKGLELVKAFDSWYDRQNGESYLTRDAKLSVEMFAFEEIACNPKLSLDTPNPEDLFSEENNHAIGFIKTNMMQSVSGSMAGISPEKRSVVFAIADAMREKKPGGLAFTTYNAALVSRTLANFPKAAELVYSGKLDRTTAFNTLFPDMKSIGVSAKNTNREIADAVNDYLTFAEETEAAWEKHDYDTHKALCRQGSECAELFNWTGATIQECRRAVKSGQTLPKAPGMTDITAELEGASGLGNAGKTQFLGDIHRAEIPSDPLTGKGLIEPENAVFRFNIGGQEFVGKVCGEQEKYNDQNQGIATAVENFCNAKVHPVQANAVFFALAQGGLVPQMSLAEHGYKAADHTAVSYTLTKDADTGTVNIKYSNPEGSPLKFSWTATVDVNGKVVATPIQIEE